MNYSVFIFILYTIINWFYFMTHNHVIPSGLNNLIEFEINSPDFQIGINNWERKIGNEKLALAKFLRIILRFCLKLFYLVYVVKEINPVSINF